MAHFREAAGRLLSGNGQADQHEVGYANRALDRLCKKIGVTHGAVESVFSENETGYKQAVREALEAGHVRSRELHASLQQFAGVHASCLARAMATLVRWESRPGRDTDAPVVEPIGEAPADPDGIGFEVVPGEEDIEER